MKETATPGRTAWDIASPMSARPRSTVKAPTTPHRMPTIIAVTSALCRKPYCAIASMNSTARPSLRYHHGCNTTKAKVEASLKVFVGQVQLGDGAGGPWLDATEARGAN